MRERSAFAPVCDEAPKRRWLPKRLSKNLHFGAVTQPANAERSFVGMMNVVENCHTHRLAPKECELSNSSV